MAITNQGVVGTGPGYGSEQYREQHFEWPRGGAGPATIPLPPGPRTVSFWMKLDKPTNGESAGFAVCTKGGVESLYIGMDESGEYPELFVGGKTVSSGNPVPGYSWHHYGYRGDGFNHALYIDGARCLQLNDPQAIQPFDRICIMNSTTPAQVCGSICAVKVWSVLLTEAELFADGRAMGSVVKAAGLFAFWPLTGPTDLFDQSGAQRDLVSSSPFIAMVPPPPTTLTRTLTSKPPKYPQENPSGSAYPPLIPRQVPPNNNPNYHPQ